MAGGPHTNLHMMLTKGGQSKLIKKSRDPPNINGRHPQKLGNPFHCLFRKISKFFLNLKQDGDEAIFLVFIFFKYRRELFWRESFSFLFHFLKLLTYSGRNAPIPAASLGPTTTSQPGKASSSSPFILATLPGMTIFLFFTLFSIPDFLTIAPTESPLNLPAAQPVRTPSPSASFTHRKEETFVASIAEETMKYVNAQLEVMRTGAFSSGCPIS